MTVVQRKFPPCSAEVKQIGAIPLLHLCDFMAWAVTTSFYFHDYKHENPKSIVRKKEIFKC